MFKQIGAGLLSGVVGMFAVAPSSTNFILKSYDYGSGGGTSSSTNYSNNGLSGTQTGSPSTSTNFGANSGIVPTINANVPTAPTLSNPNGSYNQLKLVINTSSNPSDTKYLLVISSDGFATSKYVQSDNSIGSALSISNYQTYTAWGGASGFFILGLAPSTTYQVKVKALQGAFSESALGPASTGVATLGTSLSFSLTTTASLVPPFNVNFTSIIPGSVATASANVLLDISSNAENGGNIYVTSLNSGLLSASSANTITSATADLAVAASGYGAQVSSVGQTSGGPIAALSPYNGATDNVGALSNSLTKLLSVTSPIVGGTATVVLKSKATSTTPSATDYTDTLTFIAAMNY